MRAVAAAGAVSVPTVEALFGTKARLRWWFRGANAPDALPRHERRLDAEIAERYGPGHALTEVSQAWRPRSRRSAWSFSRSESSPRTADHQDQVTAAHHDGR
jgi:hypothetical protein